MTVKEKLVSIAFGKGHCQTKYDENSGVFTFQRDAASPEAVMSLLQRVMGSSERGVKGQVVQISS